MKKLSVLFVALAVALSASAGIKLAQSGKVSTKDLKAKAMERVTNKVLRGGEAVQGTQLNAMDWQTRPTFKANRDGDILWDFEDEAQLEGWSVVDNDGDGFNWEYMSEQLTTHSGVGCMSSASYDNPTYTALTPDNWLISPKVELPQYLELYAMGQDPSFAAEVFGVYVCTGDPENLENFVQVGVDQTTSGIYKQFVYDLSEFAGQDGCIAIRHYNVTDMFRLNIDDVRLTATEPEPQVIDSPTVITEIPEGCDVYTYFRNSANIYASIFGISGGVTDGKFTVAFDMTNGDVYIQNPMWYFDSNDTWVKGTYDWTTGIITIPTGQYLSWNENYQYGIVLGLGTTYVYQDVDPETGEEGYYLGSELDEEATEISFMIDDDCIYLLDGEGDVNAEFPDNFNATGMYGYWSDDLSFSSLEFPNLDENGYAKPFGQIVNAVPAVPADPIVSENIDEAWYDCGDESGFSRFYFTLPTTDVDGNMIDPECLSYSIFTDDDQLFTFPAEDYTYDLDEDITEVPYWLYSSASDFYSNYVYMYRTNAEGFEPLFTQRIGIQVYYTVESPETKALVRNESNIVYCELPITGISSVKAELDYNAPIYNIMGQKMRGNNLPAGVYIQNGKKFIVK
jgi:hypothetical protein